MTGEHDDEYWMREAIAEARLAEGKGEVPVGAVIVHEGHIIGRGHNLRELSQDPTTHAEMIAIRQAAEALGSWRLIDTTLYVTLEPCPMCAQAISFARIRRLYYGAADPKGGGVEHGPHIFASSSCHHRPEVYGGIREGEAAALLKSFFQEKR